MLFLQNEDERRLVHVLVLADLLIALQQDLLWVLHADDSHRLAQVVERHGLDAEDVVRVEQRLKVFRREVLILRNTLRLSIRRVNNLVDALAVLVSCGHLLHSLQQLDDAVLGVLGALIEHARQKLIEQFLDAVLFHVGNGLLQVGLMLLADASLCAQLATARGAFTLDGSHGRL